MFPLFCLHTNVSPWLADATSEVLQRLRADSVHLLHRRQKNLVECVTYLAEMINRQVRSAGYVCGDNMHYRQGLQGKEGFEVED